MLTSLPIWLLDGASVAYAAKGVSISGVNGILSSAKFGATYKKFSFVSFFKNLTFNGIDPSVSGPLLWLGDPVALDHFLSANTTDLRIGSTLTSFGNDGFFATQDGATDDSGWICYFWSGDPTQTVSGQQICTAYVNDTAQTFSFQSNGGPVASGYGGGFNYDGDVPGLFLWADPFGFGAMSGDVSNTFLIPDYVDWSIESNRRFFQGVDGKPVDPAAAAAHFNPLVVLAGDKTEYASNTLGSIGPMQIIKSLGGINGLSGAGSLSLLGARIGDRVILVGFPDPSTNGNVQADFEAVITVDDQIQQLGGDWSNLPYGPSLFFTLSGGTINDASSSPSD